MAGSEYHCWRPLCPVFPHPAHLSHWHTLWRATLQEELVVQGHFLAQGLLVKVLAEVWDKQEHQEGSQVRAE